MDKKELKQALIDQFVPYDEAVQDKLDYLQSDDVFSSPGVMEEDETDELSLEDAFGDEVNSGSRRASHRHQEDYDDEDYDDEDYDEDDEDYDEDEDSRPRKPQTMAEKIAALRGISAMPGDYIRKK